MKTFEYGKDRFKNFYSLNYYVRITFMTINEKYLSGYESAKYEDKIYEEWEKSGYFNPDNLPQIDGKDRSEPFSIILPPPNVTGELHLGHADMLAIEDSIIRFQRMIGKKTL
jgi:valyl-tRNA synthetase